MPDLRDLSQPIIDDPPLTPTPLETIRARAHRVRNRRRAVRTSALLTAILVVGGVVITRGSDGSTTRVSTQPPANARVQVSTLEVGGATDVAVGSTAVWVPGFDVVRRVDPVANAVTATIPVAGTSEFRRVAVAFGSVWVTDTGTGVLTRIDETTNQVLATIPVGGSPTRMAAAAGQLWVAIPDPNLPRGVIVPVDPATNRTGAPLAIDTHQPSPSADLTAVGDTLFTTWGDQLFRIDARTRGISHVPGFGVNANDAPIGVAGTAGHVLVLRVNGRVITLSPAGIVIGRSRAHVVAPQSIAASGDTVWVLTQPSSTRPSRMIRLNRITLDPVDPPIEVGRQASGIAAGADTTWVANSTDGTLTRVDTHALNARPELCPGPVTIDRFGADGLPPADQAVNDRATAQRSLASNQFGLRGQYSTAAAITVGPGYGRAWSRDAAGRVSVVAVNDYAIMVHFRSRADCPKSPSGPIGSATPDDVPVFVAQDGRAIPPPGPVPIELNAPGSLAIDADGHLLIRNTGTRQILRLTAANDLEVVAGTGDRGYSGDEGPATQAKLDGSGTLAVGPDATVYFADSENHRIRAIHRDGRITTIAGTGSSHASGDGGPATQAGIPYPNGLAVGPDGRLWFTDGSGVRAVTREGVVHTFLAGGPNRLVIDGTAMLFSPSAVAVDTTSDVWVYNDAPKMLVKFAPDGGVLGHWEHYVSAVGLAARPGGGVVFADYGMFALERITRSTVETILGAETTPGRKGFRPTGVAIARNGTVYVSYDGASGGLGGPEIISIDRNGVHHLR